MVGFKVAGVSKHKGEVKVRFANDMTRVKILDKNGHTDINLIELPSEMDKPAVVKYLLTTDLAQSPEVKAALDEADEKYSGTKVVKAAKTKVLKTGTEKKAAAPKAKATKAKVTAKPAAKTAAKKTASKSASTTKSAEDIMAELQARAAESAK